MANRHFNKQTTHTRQALAKGGPVKKLDVVKELKEGQTTKPTRPKSSPPKNKGSKQQMILGAALRGFGAIMKNKTVQKKVSDTIKSVKGKYNIGNASKVKNKAAESKMKNSAFEAKQASKEFKKSVDKVFK